MTPFQRSLDKYLTQEPPDDTWWFERASNLIVCSHHFWDKNWDKVDKWMEFMFSKGHSPEYAAKIISLVIKRYELPTHNG